MPPGSDSLLSELLDEATNETDALLAELLQEEPTLSLWSEASLPIVEAPATRPKTRERKVDKRTHTLSSLREEVSQLTSELQRLRAESASSLQPHARTAQETAVAERVKRRRVEDECRELRTAVYAQTQFIRGLRSLFAMPLPQSPMDLSRYLHNYTRLPRDRPTRWNEYPLAQEARFQSAIDILCRETKAMAVTDEAEEREIVPSLDAPFVRSELLAHHDGFSLTSINVYALATDDLGAALRGVCVAVREIVAVDPAYVCTSRKKQIVDPDAALPSSTASNIVHHVAGIYHSLEQDELAVESHNITLYKQTGGYAALLEDFIDHDELHPQDETTDITRQVVGVSLIGRERCSDGMEHTVVRTLRTRRYRFHEHTPPAALQRFQQLIADTKNAYDLLSLQFVRESIWHEEQALTQALGQLQAIEMPERM